MKSKIMIKWWYRWEDSIMRLTASNLAMCTLTVWDKIWRSTVDTFSLAFFLCTHDDDYFNKINRSHYNNKEKQHPINLAVYHINNIEIKMQSQETILYLTKRQKQPIISNHAIYRWVVTLPYRSLVLWVSLFGHRQTIHIFSNIQNPTDFHFLSVYSLSFSDHSHTSTDILLKYTGM